MADRHGAAVHAEVVPRPGSEFQRRQELATSFCDSLQDRNQAQDQREEQDVWADTEPVLMRYLRALRKRLHLNDDGEELTT